MGIRFPLKWDDFMLWSIFVAAFACPNIAYLRSGYKWHKTVIPSYHCHFLPNVKAKTRLNVKFWTLISLTYWQSFGNCSLYKTTSSQPIFLRRFIPKIRFSLVVWNKVKRNVKHLLHFKKFLSNVLKIFANHE